MLEVVSIPSPGEPREWVVLQYGNRKLLTIGKKLPTLTNPHDRYELERLIEAQMDAAFGEHLIVHVWEIHPVLDLVIGSGVTGDIWWRYRHGA